MPRYFFDIDDGLRNAFEARDHEGTDFPNLEVARAHALQVAAAYAGRPLEPGRDGGAVVVRVRGLEGGPSLVVRLAFSVQMV